MGDANGVMQIRKFLENAYLKPKPTVQIAIGRGFLLPLYKLRRLKIVFEGVENIPSTPVIFAMNHTDRYNYWPFQFHLWTLGKQGRVRYPFTATWVKGKYYENPWMARFMKWTGNIPVPSKGYLLAKDFTLLFGKSKPLAGEDFRLLKQYVDGEVDIEHLKDAKDPRVLELISTPHGDFNPKKHTYAEYINETFYELMKMVRDLNRDAVYNKKLNLIIFPEGTRSKRLIRGKPGIAQMAIALKVPVVPVGCNGSDKVYTSDLPFIEKNGKIVYRLGKPIELHKMEPFKIDEEFVPFTPQSEKLKKLFQQATDLIMSIINNELLDEEYRGDFTHHDSTDIKSFI